MTSVLNSSNYIGTPFEPWGGLIECSEGNHTCKDSSGTFVYFSSCYRYEEGIFHDGKLIVEKRGAYCGCMLNLCRTGRGCSEPTGNTYLFGVVQVFILCFALFVLWGLFKTLFLSRKLGILELNAAVVTVLVSIGGILLSTAWILFRVLIQFQILHSYEAPSIAAGLTGGATNVAICTCMLAWHDVLIKLGSTYSKHQGRWARVQKLVITVWNISISALIGIVSAKGRDDDAAIIAMICFIIAYFIYSLRGRQLQNLLNRSSVNIGGKDPSSDPLRLAVLDIQTVIRRVKIFIALFVIVGLGYAAVAKTRYISDIYNQDTLEQFSLMIVQVILTLIMKWIGDYAQKPLLRKVNTARKRSTSIKPSSLSSKTLQKGSSGTFSRQVQQNTSN